MPIVQAQSFTDREAEQIERANASSATPVVFVHGLWLLPTSWERWAELFEREGFVALTPGWPGDPTLWSRRTSIRKRLRTRPSVRLPTTSKR